MSDAPNPGKPTPRKTTPADDAPQIGASLNFVDHLNIFHPDRFWTLSVVKADGSFETHSFEPSETRMSDVADWATSLNQKYAAIYFSLNPLRQPQNVKASKKDIQSAEWLWTDLDPPADAKNGEPLECWRAATLAKLRDPDAMGDRLPTLIVDSGRGFWPCWRLNKPVRLDETDRRKTIAEIEDRNRALSAELGGDPKAHNIDRICRLAGFINHRTGKLAAIVEHHPERRYALDEFTPLRSFGAAFEGELERYPSIIDGAAAVVCGSDYLLTKAPICVEGRHGRAMLQAVMHKLGDLGCRPALAAQLMVSTGWDARNVPPWGSADAILHEMRGLDNSRQTPFGSATPEFQYRDYEQKGFIETNGPDDPQPSVESAFEDARSEEQSAAFEAHGAEQTARLSLRAWMDLELPPRDYLLGDLLCTTSRFMITAATGVGKTLLGLDMAGAVAAGAPLLHWSGRRRARVLYFDGEMPAETMQERLRLIAKLYGVDIDLLAYNRDLLDSRYNESVPPLNSPEGIKWLAKQVLAVKPDLVVFDSMMALLGGSLKDDEQWEPMKKVIRKLTSKRIAQIWINHLGRDLSHAYGDVTREWEMDTIMRLTKASKDPNDYDINYDFTSKARLRTPHNYLQFEAKTIRRDENGWIVIGDNAVTEETARQVKESRELQEDTKTVACLLVIADALGLATTTTIEKHFEISRKMARGLATRMEEAGLIERVAGYWKLKPKGVRVVQDERAAQTRAAIEERESLRRR